MTRSGVDFPCKSCTERRPGCHSVCERYIACVEAVRETKKKRARESLIHGYFADASEAIKKSM